MALFDDLKSKLNEGVEAAKKGLSFAADKTKKGANIAKIQVEIKLEESKLNRNHAELGKHVYKLMSNGVYDMSNDAEIKKNMESISKAEDMILKYKEEMKEVQAKKDTTEMTPEATPEATPEDKTS